MYEFKTDTPINLAKQINNYNKVYDSRLNFVEVFSSCMIGILTALGLFLGTSFNSTIVFISFIVSTLGTCSVIEIFKLVKKHIINLERVEAEKNLQNISEQLMRTYFNTSAVNLAESLIFTDVNKVTTTRVRDGVETVVEEARQDTYCIFLDGKEKIQGILERTEMSKPEKSFKYDVTSRQYVLDKSDLAPFQKQVGKRLVKRLTKDN